LGLRSHRLAAETADSGRFDSEIVPIVTGSNGERLTVGADEDMRRDASMERMAALRPAFQSEAYAERFPQIEWVVTAGNSSPIGDGAAAVLIASPGPPTVWGCVRVRASTASPSSATTRSSC
jgi:acetyl-CoA acyltransferase